MLAYRKHAVAATKRGRLERIVRHVPLTAPLLLTRNAVIVAIHFCVRTVSEEKLGFGS